MSRNRPSEPSGHKRPFVGGIAVPGRLPQFVAGPALDPETAKVLSVIYDASAEQLFSGVPKHIARDAMRWLHERGLLVMTADDDREGVSCELTGQCKRGLDAIRDATEFVRQPIVQQRCAGSHFRSLKEAFASKDLATLGDISSTMLGEFCADEAVGIFITQHDWASVFRSAELGQKIEIKLPFDRCVFEFQISGRRLVALVTDTDIQLALKCTAGWLVIDPEMFDAATHFGLTGLALAPLNRVINDQINAALVALDSDVAESETISSSDKVQASRLRKGKSPIPVYRVVNLARQHSQFRPASAGDAVRESPRLHFRRGHWRHVSDGKKWINWTLVGDPDLGFVDKHYRL